MGPGVDAFSIRDTMAILKDRRVKKIILERRSTRDQWLSRQWACWSNDFSSHKVGSYNQTMTGMAELLRMRQDGSWKKWTQDRAREGLHCKCGQSTRYDNFKAFKDDVY